MYHKFDEARNMKLILTIFEQLSGLKINYHKSELFCFGEAKEVESDYMNIFGCQVAETPLTYLGIPLHYKRISNKDWNRFERKLSTWKDKLLSYGGRLTLINSVLSNLSVYMLSFFEIPKVLKKLNFYRSRFFWQGDGHKKNINYLNGIYYVDQKNKVVWELWILNSKTNTF